MSQSLSIRLHKNDNVAVARADIMPGTRLAPHDVETTEHIPAGHKVALQPLKKGDAVRKFGQIIGFAGADIAAGAHIHTQNCEYALFDREHTVGSDVRETDFVAQSDQAVFQGYKRESGRVGTRNFIGVLTTVNCSATVAQNVADHFNRSDILDNYPNVDGVIALTHGTGCGMAVDGEGFGNLQRALAGYARHPNLAGVLFIGLGCETTQIGLLMELEGLTQGPLCRLFTIQDMGGTRKTIQKGIEIVGDMLPHANAQQRSTQPASELILGLECGGSDAYSGISANPSLGHAADLLVRNGGTACLAETSEIYGAEHLLTRRAVSEEVAAKLIDRIKWWEHYVAINNGSMDNNPSPGNKAGGLTTILEKSLGAAAKGGTTNLVDVYKYAEKITKRGFVFMDTPGYDPVSVTGLVAGGANVVCFTTGRGSVFGCKPVPSIKLATNSPMYQRMSDDMDINCGQVIDGDKNIEEMGEEIFRRILATASGEKTLSETHGLGDHEFLPWQVGAVM